MLKRSISITTLVENTVTQGELLRGEHGLSIWVRTGHGDILWDTGQSGLIMENAELLGIPIPETKNIVLSHGHYDHTGGLLEVLNSAPNSCIYAHPDIFIERFTPDTSIPAKTRSIGIQFKRNILEDSGRVIKQSREPVEILPGVFMTGEIPRETGFEDVGGAFYLDYECKVPDPVLDDQSLVIKADEGLIVLLGCCHAGLINTLKMISHHWQTKKFLLIAGGMHLLSASEERMKLTVEGLRDFEIGALFPGHCTGWKSICTLSKAFPHITSPLYVGWTRRIDI